MPYGMILGIVAGAIAVAAFRALKALFAPAGSLGLSLFRPYRGDPWPRGVQEQYDVQFDWSPPKPKPPPIQPSWSDIVVAPAAKAETVSETTEVDIEELFGETAAIEDVKGSVHVAPH